MRRTPWWVLLSAAGAPVFLIGGATLAAARQPAGYDSIRDTISALAGHAATDRWVMTVGLAGLGACHLVTALGLRPAARAGRALLALGGLATLSVSALPLPKVGSSIWHGVAALVGFVTLAIWPAFGWPAFGWPALGWLGLGWPALGWTRAGAVPWGLRGRVCVAATVTLLAITGWFGFSLSSGHLVGLSERFAAGAEAVWPLIVVISCRVISGRVADRNRRPDSVSERPAG